MRIIKSKFFKKLSEAKQILKSFYYEKRVEFRFNQLSFYRDCNSNVEALININIKILFMSIIAMEGKIQLKNIHKKNILFKK